jgi:hypothetical protein
MAEITSREHVWQSIQHNQTDRRPWHFPCIIPTRVKLENHLVPQIWIWFSVDIPLQNLLRSSMPFVRSHKRPEY